LSVQLQTPNCVQVLPCGQSALRAHPQVCVCVLQTPDPAQLASVIHATQLPLPVSQYGAALLQSALDAHCTHRLVAVLQ